MKEPVWILKSVLVSLHDELIVEHGGISGVRDDNLLESSLAAPLNLYHYVKRACSIYDLAAKYCYSITRNHPFNDGNKRTAAICLELFLELNDAILLSSDEDLYFVIIDLASGIISEEIFVSWVKNHV